MAYSGTYNQTKITVDDLINFAFRDAGKTAEEITPEYVNAGKQALFYVLQNSTNRGINIWLQKFVYMGAQTDQQFLTMPPEYNDVLEAAWLYTTNPQISAALPVDNINSPVLFDQSANANLNFHATSTLSENYFGASYGQQTRLFYIGFNAYSPNTLTTYNLDLQVSNDGITWETWESFPATILADREWAYFPINTTQPFYYYRLKNRDNLNTFALRGLQFSIAQQIIPMARLNRTTYFNLPNPQFASARSLQYYFDRQISPQVYLWPVPQNSFQVFRFIVDICPQDVGSLTNELYIPNRVVPYIQAALSHKLSMQLPGIDLNRVAYLEKLALDARTQFEEQDADRSPIYFQPNYSYYTQ
jgi:hypothetical protein